MKPFKKLSIYPDHVESVVSNGASALLPAGRFTIPKLSKEQNRILEKIIEGAEIQVDWENEKICYTLCEDSGDTSPVRRDTFERLRDTGLIKMKWRPSIDVERWG